MAIQHNVITDPDLHEPKGVASATSGKVYVANGAGSGTWSYPVAGQDTALDGQVFTSDGAGAGAWEYPPAKGHGEIYITSGATAHTLGSASSFTLLNPSGEWTASGQEDLLTSTVSTGQLNLNVAGHYLVLFYITFTTDSLAAGTQYYFSPALDGVVDPRYLAIEKHTAGADDVTVSGQFLMNATASQALAIYAAGDGTSSSTNITPVEAGLTAIYLN